MEFLSRFFNWVMSRRIDQIDFFRENPHQAQEKVFEELIEAGQHTEWGKTYGYSNIQSFSDFQKQVPVSSYEQMFPYIERLLKGEQGILWPTEVKCFAKSSGTTNARSKFIPMTKESLDDCHYKAGKDMLSIFVNRYPETKFFLGKSLAIGGSLQSNEFNPKTYYGDVSALIMKNLPIWAEFMRSPGIDIALMSNYEEKIEKMARATMEENLTSLAGVPTWTVVLIERILEITGKDNILEVWPNLELFAHGAVAFGPYRDTFKKLIPSEDFSYIEIYNASEGFFGIQDTSEPDELLLLLDYGVYYEFIPMEEFEAEHPKTLHLSEVEVGKNYAVVISTNGGLWRYKIGDTVRFTSTSPYRIKISGRTKHFINAFGEEVIVENAETAVAKACHETGALVVNFTAAPVYLGVGQKGGHEWIIEFEKPPHSLEVFTKILDKTLREINSDYDAKRVADLALVPPLVHQAEHGTFYRWMKKRGKLGGQNKVPRLSNNREYLDDILELMKTTV